MIYGGYPRETIQLNSDTLWAGAPHDYANAQALPSLSKIRQLIADEQWIDAQTLLDEKFFGQPIGQAAYQPVGNLQLDFFDESPPIIEDYQRLLDLRESINRTTYSSSDGKKFERLCFASYPDRSIVYRVQASVSIALLLSKEICGPNECFFPSHSTQPFPSAVHYK